ncbi:Uma2 family endonuclease [Aerosakkonemataceae cyanobacterium BLCC-F154]|uniref:Uma2 family endonuclease n=1 Tax=Floridaenema fluviatile BLCC-F154 TaxID=3153640 RepID=A0ABV4YB44_9CYAN
MIQLSQKSINFESFISEYGDNERYELLEGELIEMEPTGSHEQVAGLINCELNFEIRRLKLPYLIPLRCLIKPLGIASAFRPDVIVLDRLALENEPLWQREPIVTLGTTIKLVVEVVSTNWQNDYARKMDDYQALGIPEYWIVDYLGLGGTFFIGSPKQPTITICQLENGSYKMSQFRDRQTLVSPTFSELELTAEQVFNAGKIQ